MRYIALTDDEWDELFAIDPDLPGWNKDEALDQIDTMLTILDNAPEYQRKELK